MLTLKLFVSKEKERPCQEINKSFIWAALALRLHGRSAPADAI